MKQFSQTNKIIHIILQGDVIIMLEFLCYSLVWIFAIYGFIEILKVIYFSFIKVQNIENDKIHILIGVRDCENYIESFIRTFFFKILNYKDFEKKNIVIVDMSSKDKTKEILKKLKEEYDFDLREIK